MRWLPRLLSHAAAAGRAAAGTTASHVRGSNGFATGGGDGPAVPREWLRRLWAEELRKQRDAARRWGRRAVADAEGGGEDSVGDFAKAARPFVNPETAAPGIERAKLKPLLSRANLLIARDIEWANIMFAFEQESRYIIMDPLFPRSESRYIIMDPLFPRSGTAGSAASGANAEDGARVNIGANAEDASANAEDHVNVSIAERPPPELTK